MILRTILFPIALTLFACASSTPPPCATAPAPAAAAGAPSKEQRLAEIRKGIVQKSATAIDVDRGALNTILDHEPELMSDARIVPEQEQGKVVGVRFFGASRDSVLGMLGIENGDRVETVNGVDMSTKENALNILTSLRKADRVNVVLNRQGQDMTIEYTVK